VCVGRLVRDDDDEKRRALSYHHDGSNSGGRTMRPPPPHTHKMRGQVGRQLASGLLPRFCCGITAFGRGVARPRHDEFCTVFLA
jgi:hypothetical protein